MNHAEFKELRKWQGCSVSYWSRHLERAAPNLSSGQWEVLEFVEGRATALALIKRLRKKHDGVGE